jgi:hypothetical protein
MLVAPLRPRLQAAGVIPEELAGLVASQSGLVTRAQLNEHGVSRAARRWALDHGWRYVLPSVIATEATPLDGRWRLVAAQLHAGPHGVVSSLTAAEWHGVTAARDPRVHLLVPADRYARSAAFVTVRRTRYTPGSRSGRHTRRHFRVNPTGQTIRLGRPARLAGKTRRR